MIIYTISTAKHMLAILYLSELDICFDSGLSKGFEKTHSTADST